jgi:hypothetical protein
MAAIMPHGLHGSKPPATRTASRVFPLSGMTLWSDREPCYIQRMSKPRQPGTKPKKKGFVIGRSGFGKISAVEGIRLTPPMKKRAADAERNGLSAEQYRQTIVRSYRKG